MDNYALLAGDLLTWVDSIDADERYEFNDPHPEHLGVVARVIHIRAGLVDLMIKPAGFNPVTREISYELAAHGHDNIPEATECFRRNREGNERRHREAEINPERAEQRAMAERMGMPLEMINRLIPLNGDEPSAVDQTRERLTRQPRTQPDVSPVSGGPVGWEGPTGLYL